MNETSIQPAAPAPTAPATAIQGATPSAPTAPATPKGAARQPAGGLAWSALKVLASLRLTVFLFVLALLLVFVGTMAQSEIGIHTATKKYFREFFVWVPFQLFLKFGQIFFNLPTGWKVSGAFPFVGGWTLGGLLLANLLAAHMIRFKVSWKRSGILMIHAGLILMMLGEVVTGVFQVESKMTIFNGEAANYVEDYHKQEVAFVSPAGPDQERMTIVPLDLLRKGGRVKHPDLPVDLQLDQYMVNSSPPTWVDPLVLGAIVARPDSTWFFKIEGPRALVAEHAEEFRTFIASIRFDTPNRPITWDKPPLWKRESTGPEAFLAYRLGPDRTLKLTVSTLGPLQQRGLHTVRGNLNRWRGQIGLGELTDEEARKQTQRIPLGLEDVNVFDGIRPLAIAVVAELSRPEPYDNPATVGRGAVQVVLEKPEVSGANSEEVDVASAYVTLYKKDTDEKLGTYLLSLWLPNGANLVKVGDQTALKAMAANAVGVLGAARMDLRGETTYDVSLRPKRTYKPYTIRLKKVRHDVYKGTNIPKNYSSEVILSDPRTNEERQALISMNNPMRYDGESFYQAQVVGRAEGTVLQIVRNPGWLMPYISCVVVTLGMLVHFGISLTQFLRRRAAS